MADGFAYNYISPILRQTACMLSKKTKVENEGRRVGSTTSYIRRHTVDEQGHCHGICDSVQQVPIKTRGGAFTSCSSARELA